MHSASVTWIIVPSQLAHHKMLPTYWCGVVLMSVGENTNTLPTQRSCAIIPRPSAVTKSNYFFAAMQLRGLVGFLRQRTDLKKNTASEWLIASQNLPV